ncbi:MAG TPA: hypothetical protein VJB87_04220 [Candidatus Nanoarchaeia archaeon]|nr:hypothetical protein [Candidatus Nanoarchaeia archaeon]
MANTESLERQVIELIATDRIDVPISSMSGKLKRAKPKLAQAIDLAAYDGSFKGERVYARVVDEDVEKARGMREGVNEFGKKYPNYGKILEGIIQEKRKDRERHLYFGVNDGRRLTSDDYMGVMRNLGFSEARAESLYQELMEVSRKLSRQRADERSVLVGNGADTDE